MMNIKYRQLKAFSLAARTLSFTEAAKAFSVTQASFSNLIKELELDLGVALFERTTRQCSLTDAGKTFYENLKGLLDHLETLYTEMIEVGQGKRGRLVIAALPSMTFGFIPEVVARFRAEYPDVEIVLHERNNEEVFNTVRTREAELGLGSMLRSDQTLHWLPMFTERLVLFVPRGHALAGKQVSWRSIEAHPYILMTTGPTEYALHQLNLGIKPVFEVEHVATAVAMVRNGLGITALPSSVIPALNLDGIALAPIKGRFTTRKLGVVHRKAAPLSQMAQIFLDMLHSHARRMPIE
jgi:LysR family carnitine catabolism transcriptional activator